MIFLFPLNRVFKLSNKIIFIIDGLVGEIQFFMESLDLCFHRRDFLNQLKFYSFLLGEIKLELLFIPRERFFLIAHDFLVLFPRSVKLVIMSSSLLFNQFLVFRDLSTE